MSYQNHHQQGYQQQFGHNPGPSGDLQSHHSTNGPHMQQPHSPQQNNDVNQPLSYDASIQNRSTSVNGGFNSQVSSGPPVSGQKFGQYHHVSQSPQNYNTPPPIRNLTNYPHLHSQPGIQPPATVAQHPPPHISSQYYSSPPVTNGQMVPPLSVPAPLSSESTSSNMPLHGSSSGRTCGFPPSSSGIGPPPLPGQQFTSSTPPARRSPASHLQDSSISSSRSTPTHASNVSSPHNRMAMPQHSSLHQQNLSHTGSSLLPPQQSSTLPSSQNQQYSSQGQISGPSLQEQQRSPPSGMPPPPLPGQQYVPQTQHIRPPPLPGQAPTIEAHPSPFPLPGQSYNPQVKPAPYQPPSSVGPPTLSGTTSQPGAMLPLPGQPSATQAAHPSSMQALSNNMAGMKVNDANRPINLMQEQRILPHHKPVENPLRFETTRDRGILVPPNRKNCQPDVLRCTLKALPHTQGLLNKVKLPLGLVIHPFKDLSSLPVISTGTIVRCKRCRTYINPFVSFVDERRWRCNMCFVVNETPEEFLHHPISKTYGQPHTRPECTNSTIEFIAPQEYMLRPPQPAVYLFLMDVSHSAIETGYLQIVCDALLEHIDRLPGDARTRIGFLTYNQTVHFYRLNEGLAQPQMIIVSDIDDVFVPTPENLLVNLRESKDLVSDLLHQLPTIHSMDAEGESDTYSALGAALEVARKLMSAFGGRVTVFQQSLPSIGPGKVEPREDSSSTRGGDASTASLNPATDFYKKMALDCSGDQMAIDFFFLNSHYIDIATLSCASRYSAGDLHYYPALHTVHHPSEAERLGRDLERYLTRKIGFESVMRIRCTKGLGVHTFHGNFFVRSTDLLSLANVSPDSGYAVNLAIEDSLTELSAACFQAALLYTTSKGERRIRVHTMCVPVVKTPAEVLNSVDCVAVVALLSKMGVDRSVTASTSDARDALVNAVIDPLKAYKETLPQGMTTGGVYVPPCLRLLPLYIHCLLKHPAFRSTIPTKLDDRVFSMINFKMQPAAYLLPDIHPDLYRVDDLSAEGGIITSNREVPQPPILPLSAESLSLSGTFLLDCGWRMYLLVGRSTNQGFINDVLGYPQFSSIEDPMYSIPERENPASELFQSFLEWLQDIRPHHASLRVIRDDARERHIFLSYLRQDRTESSMSLQEFLLHLQTNINK